MIYHVIWYHPKNIESMTILTFHHLKIRISYSQKKIGDVFQSSHVPMNGGVKLYTSILNWWNSRCETQSLRCQAVSHGDPRWPAVARRSRRCVRRPRWVSRHRDRRRVPMSTRGCRNFPTWVQWVVILLQCLLVWSLCLWVEWCHVIFGGFGCWTFDETLCSLPNFQDWNKLRNPQTFWRERAHVISLWWKKKTSKRAIKHAFHIIAGICHLSMRFHGPMS